MSLTQFSAYIVIAINDIEVILLQMPQMSVTVTAEAEAIAYPNYGTDIDLNMSEAGHPLNDLDHHDYGIDARPTFEIIRSELNSSMQEMAIQTIDFVLSACLNNYGCVANKVVETLNQLMPNSDTQWQSITGTDTVGHQLVVDIQYLKGSLLDVIFNNRHRILVYRTGVHTRMREQDVIESGRRALAINNTIFYESNPLTAKQMKSGAERTGLLKAVRRAVMTANKYLSICQLLTSESDINRANYGCIAGPYLGFDYSMTRKMSKSFLGVKLNQLFIIVFRDRFSRTTK